MSSMNGGNRLPRIGRNRSIRKKKDFVQSSLPKLQKKKKTRDKFPVGQIRIDVQDVCGYQFGVFKPFTDGVYLLEVIHSRVCDTYKKIHIHDFVHNDFSDSTIRERFFSDGKIRFKFYRDCDDMGAIDIGKYILNSKYSYRVAVLTDREVEFLRLDKFVDDHMKVHTKDSEKYQKLKASHEDLRIKFQKLEGNYQIAMDNIKKANDEKEKMLKDFQISTEKLRADCTEILKKNKDLEGDFQTAMCLFLEEKKKRLEEQKSPSGYGPFNNSMNDALENLDPKEEVNNLRELAEVVKKTFNSEKDLEKGSVVEKGLKSMDTCIENYGGVGTFDLEEE